MSAIITLATDLGLTDAYVAAMKRVMLSINPEAKLINICLKELGNMTLILH